jgi:hypothetical protein
MPRHKKMEVTSKDYSLIKENYLKSGKLINEQIVGSRKNLYDDKNKLVATYVNNNSLDLGKLSKEQFFSFMGMFNKNLYKCLIANPELLDLEIAFRGMSRKKHHENFDKIEVGGFFYNLDLNTAYWQIVYKLGYIDFEFYEKYQNNSDYKAVKRLCISFLARSNKKNYYVDGNEFTIHCDTSALKQVYSNIRNTLYRIFTECSSEVEYIAYNIDSIYIEKKDLNKVKNIFDALGLQYKLVLCQKTGVKEYTYGKDRRNF